MTALARSDLSPDQRHVYGAMLDWVRTPNSSLLTIGGYAGVGKSSLLGLFAAETKLRVAYVCFTGRASSILGRKLNAGGVPVTSRVCTDEDSKLDGPWSHLFYSSDSPEADRPFCGTIHRLLYRPYIDSVTEELLGWEKRDELDRNYDLVVIDEASMVTPQIVADIQQHGVRIMAVGDHGQLPPVMSEGSLVSRPMLRLEKIHRQAEGSPIIQLSRVLREEGRLDRSLADGDRLRFGSARDITHPSLAAMLVREKLDAAVLCWRNATRVHVNRTVRGHLGFAGKPPQVEEPLIALRNYPPIYNGMRGLLTVEATSPYKDEWWLMKTKIEFPDEGLPETEQEICRDQFHRARPFESIDDLKTAGIVVHSMGQAGKLYDFGYAMTVHKCVDPNTLIETPDGLVRAGKLTPAGRVSTPFGSAIYKNLVRNPIGPMLKISTEDGYELRVTPDHGVDVWSTDDGYVRMEAKNIKKGDIVRLRLGSEFQTGSDFTLPSARPQDVRAKKYDLPTSCTADVAEFLGLMVADGTVYRRGFRLAKRHKDVADRFDALCRKLFGAEPSRFFTLGAHHVEVSSRLISDWLLDIGGLAPKAKNVPECILVAPLNTQARFLRGLFEDGTVNIRRGVIDHVEFSSTVPEVRRIVRTMLLRFGIVSGETRSKPNLYLYGQHAKRFGEIVGFISKFKQSRLDSMKIPDGTRYVFPLRRDELHLSVAGRGVVQRHLAIGRSFSDRRSFHHSEVRDVTKYSGESVCVEVPDGHQFIQDGFCGWNSQGSQFKHAVVIVDWKQDYSNENTRRLCYTAITRAQERLTCLV